MEYLLLLLQQNIEQKREQKRERRRFLRQLRDDTNPFSLSDEVFIQNFRISKKLCSKLIEEVQPFDTQITSLPFLPRFLCALYFFAHGSYQKCVGNHCVLPMSQPSVSRSIHAMAKLIILVKGNEIKFPTTNEEKAVIKSGFFHNFGIKGTVGAIDCTHIAIVAPTSTPEAPMNLYMNRKGTYTLNVEAICDHQMIFTSINAKYPGSCHDSGIWATSPIKAHMIDNHDARRDTWLLGDQGYPLEPWLLTPLAEPSGVKEVRYNKLHNRSRNIIERAFGVLKSRFRCLSKHRVLHYSHEKAAKVVYACAILHNILLKNGEVLTDYADEVVESVNEGELQNQDNLREGAFIRRRYISTL